MNKDHKEAKAHLDEVLDDALARTFPASDPIAISVPASDEGVFSDNTEKHRFELTFADGTVFAEYQRSQGVLTITHTEVPKALEGRGLANRIAGLVVAEAKRRGLQLIAVCPFFAAYLKKQRQQNDLATPTA